MSSERLVLCLNSGSSSLKFAVFRISVDGDARIAEGAVDRIGLDGGKFWFRTASGAAVERSERFADHEAAVSATMAAVADGKVPVPGAIGHRLVHGGPHHLEPERVTPELLQSLQEVIPFAPLHLPAEIQGIEAVAARYPDLPQVACFDTAFARGLPEIARRFPIPETWHEKGLWRYGFHGLSYEYLVGALGAKLGARAVLAHLGNGSSLVAVREGKPIDTSMGFTPAGGMMMGTRAGDLDPGLLVFLLDGGLGVREVEKLVNRDSGLVGVSGTTSDMKMILERRTKDERAALAFEMFSYQARKWIGAFAAALGGLDTLVFTGDREHAAPVRERVCAGLEFLGVHVDRARNRASRNVISSDGSPCTVHVVGTDEESMIARHAARVLFNA